MISKEGVSWGRAIAKFLHSSSIVKMDLGDYGLGELFDVQEDQAPKPSESVNEC